GVRRRPLDRTGHRPNRTGHGLGRTGHRLVGPHLRRTYAPWDVIPCHSAWAVEAPEGTSRPSRTSSRSLCVFLVLVSRRLGPIMVQTSLESALPRWAPPWPSQVIAPCGGPRGPPRHFSLTLSPRDLTTSSRVIARRAREAAGSGYGSSTPDP